MHTYFLAYPDTYRVKEGSEWSTPTLQYGFYIKVYVMRYKIVSESSWHAHALVEMKGIMLYGSDSDFETLENSEADQELCLLQ